MWLLVVCRFVLRLNGLGRLEQCLVSTACTQCFFISFYSFGVFLETRRVFFPSHLNLNSKLRMGAEGLRIDSEVSFGIDSGSEGVF